MKDKKSQVAVIDFTKFDIQQLPELHGKKEEIKKVIEANPVVKITDNTSYELAKKSRTAVKTLRTSLEKEKKDVNDRIKNNVLLVVANEYDSLIADVKNDENERQEEVTAWETVKENERLEKIRLEQERVDGIKNSIAEFGNFWMNKIATLHFLGLESFEVEFGEAIVNFDRDSLAEFDVLFTDVLSNLTYLISEKKSTLLAQENIRLEQIRLAEEREKQRIEEEKQAERLRVMQEEFESEQKRVAEEQRITQENFLREKREFEEKKNKEIQDTRLAKWTERFSNPEIRNEIMLSFSKDIGFYIRAESSDEEFSSWVTEFGNRYVALINQEEHKAEEDLKRTHPECVRKDGSFNFTLLAYAPELEDYHEEDVDPKGVVADGYATSEKLHNRITVKIDENNMLIDEKIEAEFKETWRQIYSLCSDQTQLKKNLSTKDVFDWLEVNYNVPSRKN